MRNVNNANQDLAGFSPGADPLQAADCRLLNQGRIEQDSDTVGV